jgi:hypothetical protein
VMGALTGTFVATFLLNLFFAKVFPLERNDTPLPATAPLRLWGMAFLGLGTAVGICYCLWRTNATPPIARTRVEERADG